MGKGKVNATTLGRRLIVKLKSMGRQAMAYGCHVGHWDEIQGLIDATYERFGSIDILINNAGMSPLYDKLSEVSEALFDKVIDVNLKGPFRMMAYAGERMSESGGGSSGARRAAGR